MTGWKKKNKYRNLKVGSMNEVTFVFKYYKKSYVNNNGYAGGKND